jgi:hypothetical protein
MQNSLTSVIGWVTKMYYLEILRASEYTLSCWSRSLASTPVSRRVDVRQTAGRKTNCRKSQHDERHVIPNPLSGIRVRKRRWQSFKTWLLLSPIFRRVTLQDINSIIKCSSTIFFIKTFNLSAWNLMKWNQINRKSYYELSWIQNPGYQYFLVRDSFRIARYIGYIS